MRRVYQLKLVFFAFENKAETAATLAEIQADPAKREEQTRRRIVHEEKRQQAAV